MPTNGEDRANDAHPADAVPGIGTAYAVDTSVAIAALDGAHTAHEPCLDAVRRLRPALAGQAAFETHSVLTRMPGSLAVESATASRLIKRVFPTTLWLSPEHASALLAPRRRRHPGGLDVRRAGWRGSSQVSAYLAHPRSASPADLRPAGRDVSRRRGLMRRPAGHDMSEAGNRRHGAVPEIRGATLSISWMLDRHRGDGARRGCPNRERIYP